MKEIVVSFWEKISNANFDGLRAILSVSSKAYFPNTREVFNGCEAYIEYNKNYPDRWFADIEEIYEVGNIILSIVKVYNPQTISFYVTGVFTIEQGKIVEWKEYWGNNSNPPLWRVEQKLSERY